MNKKLLSFLISVLGVLALSLPAFAESIAEAEGGGSGLFLWILLGVMVLFVLVYMVFNIIRTRKEERNKEKLIKPRLIIVQHGKK
jgi:hypothetical protein